MIFTDLELCLFVGAWIIFFAAVLYSKIVDRDTARLRAKADQALKEWLKGEKNER